MIKIAPSVLSADFCHIESELKRVDNADFIHCDVMDGHFVPNISFGPKMVADIKRATKIPLDVHLMISEPIKYIDKFIEAGAEYITIHLECNSNTHDALKMIKDGGVKCGLAISPNTAVDDIIPYVAQCDLLLLMSVYPGFSGQKFIEGSYERLNQLKLLRDELNKNAIIEMDGGIGSENIARLYRGGVELAVAGNAVFKSVNPNEAIEQLKNLTFFSK